MKSSSQLVNSTFRTYDLPRLDGWHTDTPEEPSEEAEREYAAWLLKVEEHEDFESLCEHVPSDEPEMDQGEVIKLLNAEERIAEVRAEYTWTEITPGVYLCESPSGKRYEVKQTQYGPVCSCPAYAHSGKGTCKHCISLLRGVTVRHKASQPKQNNVPERNNLAAWSLATHGIYSERGMLLDTGW